MRVAELDALVSRLGVDRDAESARTAHLVRSVQGANAPGGAAENNAETLARKAMVLEGQAIASFLNDREQPPTARFAQAYDCWRKIIQVSSVTDTPAGLLLEASHPRMPSDIALGLHLSACGLMAQRPSDVRLDLRDALPNAAALASRMLDLDMDWPTAVTARVGLALVLLCRKDSGWSDVGTALEALTGLRAQQETAEPAFLDGLVDQGAVESAIELVGWYHLAQMVTTIGTFLQSGDTSSQSVSAALDRHHSQATEVFIRCNLGSARRFADLAWIISRCLLRASIWEHVEGLGSGIRNFVQSLTSSERNNPVLELWPSQQQALRSNFFDSYRRAILVQMPTSGGKTLLAKFAIIQTLALNPNSPIAYVVPTRALVNQITRELRDDFRELDFSVEQTVPAFELDPVEESLLSARPNVLVTTPEKLSLLIRRGHESVRDLALVILDEAHNLGDGERGARLELTLASVRRDHPDARFLLLSPFLPNGSDIVDWLGDERGLPISVSWRPSRKVVGALSTKGRAPNRRLTLTTLDAADNTDLAGGIDIDLGEVSERPTSIKATTALGVRHFRSNGTTLVLCWGKGTAIERARELAADAPTIESTPLLAAARRFISDELGPGNSLSECLNHGVAYHHAGLSHEVRAVVEGLVRRGQVNTVCGTTTLAQGVNFPISQVLLETRRKGRHGELTYADLWNIGGRAGRALMDDVGLLALPVTTVEQLEGWQTFLRGEAAAISSQLAELIDKADEIGGTFNMGAVRMHPGLGDLMQYLAHTLRVSGSTVAADVEDLLRSSLVYRQVSADSNSRAQKFVELCRSYIQSLSGRTGLLGIADGTGFSTPSVFSLLARKGRVPSLANERDWQPSILFAANTSALTERVEAIAELPEMALSHRDDGPFNAERIANILRDWVNGVGVQTMAATYGDEGAQQEKRLTDFSAYLYGNLIGKASWGIGALQSVCTSTDDTSLGEQGYAPSMIFFGVDSREAVWLRMAGVPRHAAMAIAPKWVDEVQEPPRSFQEIRSWIANIHESEWDQRLGRAATRGSDMNLLWSELLS